MPEGTFQFPVPVQILNGVFTASAAVPWNP
jgi:hypothetical protein